jgi:thioredoxin-like negative regulator of GroEL
VTLEQRRTECWGWYRASLRPIARAALLSSSLLCLSIAARPAAPDLPPASAAQLKAAASFHRQGDYAHSIPLLKQLVDKYPRNYDANLLLGQDLVRSGNIAAALAPLHVASEVRPDDATALTFLADAAIDAGDQAAAAQALQAAVARSPKSVDMLVKWADHCLDRSRVVGQELRTSKRDEATMLRVTAADRKDGDEVREQLLEQSAAQDPEQRGIWGELGGSQIALAKSTEAAESLKQARQREPQETETLRLEALVAALEQRWPDAEKQLQAIAWRSTADFKRILNAWPDYLVPGADVSGAVWDCMRHPAAACPLTSAKPRPAQQQNAKDLYLAGRWEQLAALPASNSSDNFDSLWRGVALARTGDCPHAIPPLERGFKADTHAAGYWLEVCYAAAGEKVLAQLKAAGDEVAIHELKGDLLLRLKNDGAAAQWEYAAALKARPNDPHLLARLADAYDRVGDGDHAKETAKAALSLDPHEPLAIELSARMAMSDRDYTEAIVRLKQMLALDPADDWAKVQLGLAYGQTGSPDSALHYLQPELEAGYPDKKGALHAQLANILRKLGRDDDAKAASAEASRLAKASLEGDENGSGDAHP